MDPRCSKHATCQRLRSLVQEQISQHMYRGAVFFADKLVTLSESQPGDVYLLAQAHYVSKEYRRALTLLNKHSVFEKNIRFRYLAAKCLAECHDWEECLSLLGADDLPETLQAKEEISADKSGTAVNMYSLICVLRGKVYEALENRQRAVKWYRVALETDPYCYEAYEALMGNHMLTNEEEHELTASIKFKPEDSWLKLLYATMGKKYEDQGAMEESLRVLEGRSPTHEPPQPLQPSFKQNDQRRDEAVLLSEPATRSKTAKAAQHASPDGAALMESQNMEEPRQMSGMGAVSTLRLAGNVNVMAARAEFLFCQGCHMEAYKLTSQIIRHDPHALECIAVHLACIVELGKKNELFKTAHRLVQDYPERGIAWYGVGCYYLCTGQYDCARRYFGKATQLQPNLAQAWITYGHAFAAQDESDMALAAYRTAARLFPGLHQPVLGMGREYQHMNNLNLAEQMYMQAYQLCKRDPLVCNELGVLCYLKKDYSAAVVWLKRALEILSPVRVTAVWQPTIVNLAHTFRKQQQYDLAIEMYNQALGLKPYDHGTFTALGFTYHLQSKLELAIENYHKALGFKPDDATTTELLKDALQLHCVHCSTNDDPGLM